MWPRALIWSYARWLGMRDDRGPQNARGPATEAERPLSVRPEDLRQDARERQGCAGNGHSREGDTAAKSNPPRQLQTEPDPVLTAATAAPQGAPPEFDLDDQG